MLCLTQSIFALSPNPRKLATKSGRLLTSYFLKERSDTSKLLEAKALIDEAISLDKDSVHFNVFLNKGKVYNEISINQKFKNLHPFAELQAYGALRKASQLAVKNDHFFFVNYELQGNASVFEKKGNDFYKDRQYDLSHQYYSNIITINDLIKKNGGKPFLATKEKHNNYLFRMVLSAMHIDSLQSHTLDVYALYEDKYPHAAVYEAMYILNAKEWNAYNYITEGRKLFPDDLKLLEREINKRLDQDDFSVEMEELLKKSLKIDKYNLTVRTALGNLYFERTLSDESIKQHQLNYENAEIAFKDVLKYDKNYPLANLNLGLLYYNEGARMSQNQENYSNKVSLKEQINFYFDKSLFYLERFATIEENNEKAIETIASIYDFKGDQTLAETWRSKLVATD